jgi:formiminotetrahydrofolate cyclodeaminase
MVETKDQLQPETLLELSVKAFVAATAGKTPIPGGGSVAGVVAALATALGEMSVAFTRGKKAFAAYEKDLEASAVKLARARGMLHDLTADDASAYLLYQDASKAVGPDKDSQTQTALAAAINVPRQMTAVALSVMEELKTVSGHCNRWLLSDLAAAAILAEATVRLCDYNVRVNAPNMIDKAAAEELRHASTRDCRRAEELRSAVEKVVAEVM